MSDFYIDEMKKVSSIPRFVFFVEGPAEIGLVETYLNSILADQKTTKILCYKGNARLSSFIKTFVMTITPNKSDQDKLIGIGFVADSETNPADRIDAIINAAKLIGFQHCGTDLKGAYRHQNLSRRIAFSLSPIETSAGRIEDLILEEIKDDPVLKCINSATPCLDTAIGRKLDTKALVQMFISAKMNESTFGIRVGFKAKIFDVLHDSYARHRATIDNVLHGW